MCMCTSGCAARAPGGVGGGATGDSSCASALMHESRLTPSSLRALGLRSRWPASRRLCFAGFAAPTGSAERPVLALHRSRGDAMGQDLC